MREVNDDIKKEDLLLNEEKIDNSLIQIESKKRMIPKSYNRSMKHKHFIIGDWILRKVLGNKGETTYEKISSSLEGPYQIYDVNLGSSYCI